MEREAKGNDGDRLVGLRLAAVGTAVAVVAAVLSTGALAHHGEPATGGSEPGELGESTNTGVSTDREESLAGPVGGPVPKPGEDAGWQQIAGSRWDSEQKLTRMASPSPREPSPTPYDLDFYGVDFLTEGIAMHGGLSEADARTAATSNGLAVGAQCRRSDPREPVAADDVAGCERIPVIYRYYEHPTRGLIWEESYRGDDADDRGGFAAAVAWLGSDRALVVGGTGTYPRRESERRQGESTAAYAARDEECVEAEPPEQGPLPPELDPGSDPARAISGPRPGQCEGAGMARVWLFDSGSWRELRNEPDPPGGFTGAGGDEIPDDMRALTAAGGSPRPGDCGAAVTDECASVGGMQQIWNFAGGSFQPQAFTGFSYRVRDSRFAPPPGVPPGHPKAIAVTAGCCAEQDSQENPRVLQLLDGQWQDGGGGGAASDADSYFGLRVYRGSRTWDFSTQDFTEEGSSVPATPDCGASPEYCAIFYWPVTDAFPVHGTGVRAPGGPRGHYADGLGRSAEPRSCATGAGFGACEQHGDVSLRLVAGDGDLHRACRGWGNGQGTCRNSLGNPSTDRADGKVDWAVGVLRRSGEGAAYNFAFRDDRSLGAQGLGLDNCSGDDALLGDSSQGVCSPEGYQKGQRSHKVLKLGSYALNAFRIAGEDQGRGHEGTGWAVGDHGAIVTRAGAVAGPEQTPERKGEELASEPLDSGAFDPHRAEVTDQPGLVAALAPGIEPVEPGFYENQTPGNNVGGSRIVMSRDGSEGWTLTRDTFLRYDGSRWTSCDPHGVEGLLPPDPACAELAGVGNVERLVRVPLEHDADPANDDEFEAVALTAEGLYRYRRDRWSFDEEASYEVFNRTFPVTGTDIAFTAPDDGWVVKYESSNSIEFTLLHFDGEQWVDCVREPDGCGYSTGRVPNALELQCGFHGGRSPRLATADERVYLYATREARERPPVGGYCNVDAPPSEPYPLIVYRDRGGEWHGGEDTSDDGAYNPADGGWDPGCTERDDEGACVASDGDGGRVRSLAVARNADGSYHGWAVGTFGGAESETADAVMMRLDEAGEGCSARGCWRPWDVPDAANDYLRLSVSVDPDQQLTLPAEAGRRNAFLLGSFSTAGGSTFNRPVVPALGFDRARGRWEAIPTPWSAQKTRTFSYPAGQVQSIAADGRGGLWAGVAQRTATPNAFSLHHYTDRAPREVLAETMNPAREAELTALGAGQDGTLWLGDENGFVYRYDRLAGWSRPIRIPAWDAGRVTNPADVNAIAVGPGGEAVAVGRGGRIATLGDEVGLDPAATIACENQPAPPCGTGRTLLDAAVAPDGSAIVSGEQRTLLWRPPGGDFRPIATPQIPLAIDLVDVEMPSPDRAYLLSERNGVFAGTMSAPGEWSWAVELGDPSRGEDPLTATPIAEGDFADIRDVAVDASGHGYAVGEDGLLLERSGGDDPAWRRLDTGFMLAEGSQDRVPDLNAVALPAGGGDGALIGGTDGIVLTMVGDRPQVVRHPDPYDPVTAGGGSLERGIVGLALAPGYRAGEVEAWAAIGSRRSGDPQSLLHYSSSPDDSRLQPARALAPLPDSPAPALGELSFAVFGKQECFGAREEHGQGNFSVRNTCGGADGSNMTHDLMSRRIRDELADRSGAAAGPRFALFTGDAVDLPGGRETVTHPAPGLGSEGTARTPVDTDLKHARWVEIAAQPLADRGLPVLGAIGGQDLTRNVEGCYGNLSDVFIGGCAAPAQAGAEQSSAQVGANLPWRTAIARVPAPWELDQRAGGFQFERLEAGVPSQQGPDAATPALTSPRGGDVHPAGGAADAAGPLGARVESYKLGSGDTHYAQDVIDEESGEKVARIIVVDTSMRSLAASDAQQHPVEVGGQLRWLEEMLCFDGSEGDIEGVVDCTRAERQRAVVVSNTPTYSYGPISPEELHQVDATAFESVLLRHRADVVVSGALGWNGLYWATAPGVHEPCPGEPYQTEAPEPGTRFCGQAPEGGVPDVAGGLSEALAGADAPAAAPPPPELDVEGAETGALPFVVSSTAGGNFNLKAERSGQATAESGFWRGYSVVRLHPSGDPAKTVVEQRPILDWVGLNAQSNTLRPGQRMTLRGYAREAFGNDRPPRYYDIDSPAITHRYDLIMADPDEPWAAFEDANGDYVPVPSHVATVDRQTGRVRTGKGNRERTYTIAVLSVGDKVAGMPLVFEPRRSFAPQRASLTLPGFARPARAPAAQPPLRAAEPVPPPPPPPPAAPGSPIASQTLQPPQPPALPSLPSINAAAPPAPPALNAPPPPPPPPQPPAVPPQPQPQPLALGAKLQAVSIVPSVNPPAPPPVNPAPPAGSAARKEAKQRQAATAKSEEGAGEKAEQATGDLADAPRQANGAQMTRSDATHPYTAHARPARPAPSITPLSAQPRAPVWSDAVLYSGGFGLVALTFALAYLTARPTPRRRPPEVPAPAPAWSRGRRR